jgi:hypothetical protein
MRVLLVALNLAALWACAPSPVIVDLRPDTRLYVRNVESKDVSRAEIVDALAKLDVRDTNFHGMDSVPSAEENTLILDVTSARVMGPAQSYGASAFNVTLKTAMISTLFITQNPWWVFIDFMELSPANHIRYTVSYTGDDSATWKSAAEGKHWFQKKARTKRILMKDFRTSVELLLDSKP